MGSLLRRSVAGLCLVLATSVVQAIAGGPAHAVDPPGPALATPPTTMQSKLSCSSDLASSSKTPILLIAGTISTAEQAWAWGYQKVLRQQGYPVCGLSLPGGGTGDIQTTVEYVVHAIRSMHAASGRRISLIGHSQGGMLPAWALQFWPDLPGMVDDAILLDAPVRGLNPARLCDATHACPAIAWQGYPGSSWTKALIRRSAPAATSWTSIGAGYTDIVTPGGSSTKLPGATNLVISSICPGRFTSHLDVLGDNVAYALAMDALTHAGPASLSRINTSTACGSRYFPGVVDSEVLTITDLIGDILARIFEADWIDGEPALRSYAVGAPGDTNLALNRPAYASSTEGSLSASRAVDGNTGTRWGSGWWRDPSWIYVDLGTVKIVNGVQLLWEDAYAREYDVLYWSNGAWVHAFHTSSGDGGSDVIALDGLQTRYVKIQGTRRGTSYGYSLWELQVVGH